MREENPKGAESAKRGAGTAGSAAKTGCPSGVLGRTNDEPEYAAAEPWWVYILRCADGTLYTGSTDDIERRAKAHNAGKGAKYTRGRGPVSVVYREACAGRSAALKREAAIKRLTRPVKEKLIRG